MGDRSQDRERRVVSALRALWSPPSDARTALLVGDIDGHLNRDLAGSVESRTAWCRWSTIRQPGQAWPKRGDYAFATLRLPREKDTLLFSIETIAAQLDEGAPLWVYGSNDEGIKSAARHISPFFDDVRTVGSKHHCRVWCGRRNATPARDALDQWVTHTELPLPSGSRKWTHLPGVFAKGGLDSATALLLEALEGYPTPTRVLDFACGGGVIGAELAARWSTSSISGLDADAVAIEAARANSDYTELYTSDSWSALDGLTYDLIVSNPPIHRGKSEDLGVLESLIERAREFLNPGGSLWLVGQKRLNLARRLDGVLKANCERDDGRFQVWSAR